MGGYGAARTLLDRSATRAQARRAAALLRAERPLVHVICGAVSAQRVADTLLAAGAAPVMAIAPDEVADVAAAADALALNLGALAPGGAATMGMAAAAAAAAGRPWALDPVGAGGAQARTAAALSLAARGPRLIRGNASEILALAGQGGAVRGVDAADPVAAAAEAAAALAAKTGGAVLASGAIDLAVDAGAQRAEIAGGDPVMASVTAIGCALTAYGAALLGAGLSPMAAATGAAAAFAVAGAEAAGPAAGGKPGPGAFPARFLDALHALGAEGAA